MAVACNITLAPDLALELDRLAESAQVTRDQIVEQVLRSFLEARITPLEGNLSTMAEILYRRTASLSDRAVARRRAGRRLLRFGQKMASRVADSSEEEVGQLIDEAVIEAREKLRKERVQLAGRP